MAKVDYVKINNTIKYIQNVAYLSELPVATENSADFVSVNNELYVKQVNGTTYTYAKVGGSGGGSAEPIIKTMTETETGVFLVFTEEELTQIQNNIGTVVKVDMGGGEYLPLSPAYVRLSMSTMQMQLILCCEIVEYNAWYKFKPTEDPLVYAIDQDMSSPFGGGNDIEQEYQFIEFPLTDIRDSGIASAAATVNIYVGLLDNQNNFPSSKPLVLIEGDIDRAKAIMQQLAMTKVPLEDDVNVCIASCNGTVIRYIDNQKPIYLPIVEVSSFIEDDNEIADGIKNGTYSVKTNVYSVKGTNVPIISYTGFYNGTQITFEARPLYQKLLGSNSYQETSLYAIVFADVSSGAIYIQQGSIDSAVDCKTILEGNYTSVRYMQNNEVLGNIVYKTSDTYICEIFGDFTNENINNYVGVIKTYLRCKYDANSDGVLYGYFQNIASSVIANPKSGELNNATSGGTLTQLLVNDKVYDIPSGGGTGGASVYVLEKTLPSDTNDIPIIELTVDEFNTLWEQDFAVIKASLTQAGFGKMVSEYNLLSKSDFTIQEDFVVCKAMLFKSFMYMDYLGLIDAGRNFDIVAIYTKDPDTEVESVNVYKTTDISIVADGSSLVFDYGVAGFEFSEEAKSQIKTCKAFGIPFTVIINDLHAENNAYGTIKFFNTVVDTDGVITSTPYTYINPQNQLVSISFSGIDTGSNILTIKTLSTNGSGSNIQVVEVDSDTIDLIIG